MVLSSSVLPVLQRLTSAEWAFGKSDSGRQQSARGRLRRPTTGAYAGTRKENLPRNL